MGDTKNLALADAVAKIKELSDSIKFCMFCTYRQDGRITARPMTAQEVDEEGNIWFLSSKGSDKDMDILRNDAVELLYASGSDNYLALHGNAELLHDKELVKRLWTPVAKVWFTEGVDDPTISVIKVTPSEGHYWDSKHGRVVQFASMLASLVTGKTMDDGVEGKISL